MSSETKRPEITVLTDPIPCGMESFSEGVRQIARSVRDRIHPNSGNFNRSPYRGHPAVTRSLIKGLKSINASFNYNPRHPNQLANTVIVLAGIRTLRQVIRLKRQGLLTKLYAGPNIVVFSSEYDSILASPEIDCVITPCDWVIDLYVEDNPRLHGRCFAWPAGVDTDYWKPSPENDRDRILIFEKQSKEFGNSVQLCVEYLRGLGWGVDIVRYGFFTHSQYLQMLKRSCLMLGFSTSESQGIAWAEAWSVDVPTLLWKNTSKVYRDRRYNCSTAPYLRPENGLFWNDLEDFKAKFAKWESHRGHFAPRKWVLENMSDEVCASILYKKVTKC